jgi:BetI-type transcriptional repressor, C-terminal
VRAVLVEMLPLDEPRRLEAHVGFAFLARAAVVPEVAERLRGQFGQLVDFLTGQLHLAQSGGGAPQQLDARQEALTLIALVDGLTAHVLAGLHRPDAALAVVDNRLQLLFPETDPGVIGL